MTAHPLPRTLGIAVAGRRRVCGFTQRELAERAGITPQYVNDIEHDRRAPTTAATLLALSQALNHDPADLFLLVGRLPPEDVGNAIAAGPDRYLAALAAFRAALMGGAK